MYHRVMADGSAGDVDRLRPCRRQKHAHGLGIRPFWQFEDRTLLARALELAQSITPRVSIVGSREKFGKFAPVVEDIFPDRGPLAGIHAALRSSQTDLNLMLAVDMPFVPAEFLNYLVGVARQAPDAMVIFPLAGDHRQTLCAIYRREFADAAEKALRAGNNRIDSLFNTIPQRMIGTEELQRAGFSSAIFRNLNSPADLETAKQAGPQTKVPSAAPLSAQMHPAERQRVLSLPTLNFATSRNPLAINVALIDVNFNVMPGETVCILGRSGVGKSVSLQLLHGLSQGRFRTCHRRRP